jgi:flagellar biosynthesis protein FlhF
MEMYIEKGSSRKDCELKIAEKYKRPFQIWSEKKIRIGGFLGLLSKPGVEVEFFFSPTLNKNPSLQGYHPASPLSWLAADASAQQQRQYTVDPYSRNAPADLEEEKRKVIAAAGKNYDKVAGSREAAQQILDSINETLNEKFNEIKETINSGAGKEEHPAFTQAGELLRLNDFSEKYVSGILERMRKELPLETLEKPDAVQEHLLEWIGESISIYKEENAQRRPRVMVLVGPTGVGKTTTISKLAAIFGIGTSEIPAVDVRMITIDAYRIGAKAQLESLGNIMQIPVSCVDNKQDMKKEIALSSEYTDLFLVDTIGKSPKDSAKLGEMKEILEGCGKGAEVHLVIGAGTKASDIEDILRQFEPFNYRSVILTKMDETDRIGNVVSALAEKRKSVSYITDGQKIPNDIRKASVVRFLVNLDGFKVDREKIEKRFPSGEADQFKWS